MINHLLQWMTLSYCWIVKQSLINLFRLITSKDFIDYINLVSLNRVHNEDYYQLVTNILDNLSTPSDWSSIGSDYESDDSIINIRNVKINIHDTIKNPISPQPYLGLALYLKIIYIKILLIHLIHPNYKHYLNKS